MNEQHARKGHKRLTERRAALVDELHALTRRQSRVAELLVLAEKQTAAAAEAVRVTKAREKNEQ